MPDPPPEPMPDPAPEPKVYEHRGEDRLEPTHLIRRSDVILRAGILMLGAGTGSRRVLETMAQVARALDIDGMQAQVSFAEIVLTVQRRGIFRTQVARIAAPGVNADRIAALQRFAAELTPHMTVAAVEERLDAVVERGARYPQWVPPLGAALACAAFAYLNRGGPVEVGAVAVASGLAQWARHRLISYRLNQLAVVLVAAATACLIYAALLWGLSAAFGLDTARHESGLTSAVLFLVPGFPLVTATLDLARLDLAAGISRMTYAGLVTVSASLGTWLVATGVGLHPQATAAYDAPTALVLPLRAVATFVGVFGFGIVFNSPLRVAFGAGAVAVIPNVARLSAVDAGMAPQIAAALAALGIGLLAWAAGTWLRLPRIILSVPSVIIMIPGAAAFRALVDFNDRNVTGAVEGGIQAVLVVMGMAAGLAAARMLTDPDWAFTQRPEHLPLTDAVAHLSSALHRH